MLRTSFIAGIFALGASGAFAATVVDFEDTPGGTADPFLIAATTPFVKGDITFTSTETMKLVQVGPPTNAFVPNDDPGTTPSGAPADFGQWFLTGDFNGNTDMNLSFGSAVRLLSFEIVDIDGGSGNQQETFTFGAYNGGILKASLTSTGLNSKPDATVETFTFGGIGFFDEIRISGTTVSGARNIGWGIDNITTTPVPVPAAGLLLLTAVGGAAAMRRRNKKA